ncbi:MAG: hypothetical protein QOD58_4601 [Mycobacterium sp.]|nr:hypothetical protein [Mycobacterium sp.]
MHGHETKNTVRLQKMTRYRLGIQQITLSIRMTLHTKNHPRQINLTPDRHAELFRTLISLLRIEQADPMALA